MPSSAASGTQTATIGTTHTLATLNTAANYLLNVDLSNMADGDVVKLAVNKKVLTGGSAKQVYQQTFYNARASGDDAIAVSVPFTSLYQATVTLLQSAGTGRNFDWNVEQL